MRLQITYNEPIPQFDDDRNRTDVMTEFTVIANNEEERQAHDTAIRNPDRGIVIIEEWHEIPPSIDDLIAKLETIDRKSVRPMRAIMKGVGTDEDTERLATLEQQAEDIREQIHELDA